jgi:hypothetical protein
MEEKMTKGIDSKLDDWQVVSIYTRADALQDGVLVDVSEMAAQAGIPYPTAMTDAVYQCYVRVPEGVSCQDEKGRLWDILYLLGFGILQAGDASEIRFSLSVQNNENLREPVQLKAVCGRGDCGEPVITIMLPDED